MDGRDASRAASGLITMGLTLPDLLNGKADGEFIRENVTGCGIHRVPVGWDGRRSGGSYGPCRRSIRGQLPDRMRCVAVSRPRANTNIPTIMCAEKVGMGCWHAPDRRLS